MTSPLTDFSLVFPQGGPGRAPHVPATALRPDFRLLFAATSSNVPSAAASPPRAAKAAARPLGSGKASGAGLATDAAPELPGLATREAEDRLSRAKRSSASSLGSETSSGAPEKTPAASPSGGPRSSRAENNGFERSADPRAPHLPRFKNVPEAAKYPSGPYQQAPPEYGGDWWLVNPFTGPQPWLRLDHLPSAGGGPSNLPDVQTLPEGFVELFGPQPERRDFRSPHDHRIATIKWQQDLKYFHQAGTPEGIDEDKLNLSIQAFEEWGLGRPQFYEGRYGWRIRFPESTIPDFEMMPSTALQAPHIIIARYQIRLLREGATLDRPHPWIPPHLLPGAESTSS